MFSVAQALFSVFWTTGPSLRAIPRAASTFCPFLLCAQFQASGSRKSRMSPTSPASPTSERPGRPQSKCGQAMGAVAPLTCPTLRQITCDPTTTLKEFAARSRGRRACSEGTEAKRLERLWEAMDYSSSSEEEAPKCLQRLTWLLVRGRREMRTIFPYSFRRRRPSSVLQLLCRRGIAF